MLIYLIHLNVAFLFIYKILFNYYYWVMFEISS